MAIETEDIKSKPPYSPALARALLVSAQIFGMASMLMWLVFVFHGGFDIVKFGGLNETQILFFDAALCMVFFVQHSTMARSSFQRRLSRFLHADLHGAVFTICSALPLMAAIILWQKSDNVLVPINGVYRYLMHSVFVLGFVGFHFGTKALGRFDMMGTETIQRRLKGTPLPPPVPFTVRGLYLFVRHPLYLACLLMIWSCPNFTSDRLLHNVLWTVWIVVGTILEERELSRVFGADYKKYQKEVPMLFPWKIIRRRESPTA